MTRYLRMKEPEVSGLIVDSSVDREETFHKLGEPKTKADVIAILGDTSHKRNKLFRGDNRSDEYVKTIAAGKFFFYLRLKWYGKLNYILQIFRYF